MNERRKIEEKIRKKEEEIQALESHIREARIDMKALHDVLQILARSYEKAVSSTALRPGSGVAKARELILERGEPVHVLELLEGLGKPATREARASLSGSLAAY